MFLWLKTLYRKRAVTWPFIFYTIIWTLSTVDTCILDYTHQSALGNINLLLGMNKKLYLNDSGIIKTAMILEGIESSNVNDIEKMSFIEFTDRKSVV